jgi:hypothetical protein
MRQPTIYRPQASPAEVVFELGAGSLRPPPTALDPSGACYKARASLTPADARGQGFLGATGVSDNAKTTVFPWFFASAPLKSHMLCQLSYAL